MNTLANPSTGPQAQAAAHPDGSVDCTVQGPLLLIAINRPVKRNGFTPKMFRELGEAYTRLDDEPAMRKVAPPVAMMPRLTSSCENRQSSAAITTSAASISSMPSV